MFSMVDWTVMCTSVCFLLMICSKGEMSIVLIVIWCDCYELLEWLKGNC